MAVPENIYLVCGHKAYKWLSENVTGLCTIARLTPATFIVPHSKIDINAKHTLYRRAKDNIPRPNGKPHVVEMSIPNTIFSTLFIYPMLMQMWDYLVVATDYLDDQIWQVMRLMNISNIM